jgi:dihydropyrimidinase
MRDGIVTSRAGSGRYLACAEYDFIQPTGRLPNGFDASAFG